MMKKVSLVKSCMLAVTVLTFVQSILHFISTDNGHHDHANNRFLSSSLSSSLFIIETKRSIEGGGHRRQYTDLHIGTPSQQVSQLLVDTGSFLTSFPCGENDDVDGESIEPLFHQDKSTTFQKISCLDEKCNDILESISITDVAMNKKENSCHDENDTCHYVYNEKNMMFEGVTDTSTLQGTYIEYSFDEIAVKEKNASFDLTFGCQTPVLQNDMESEKDEGAPAGYTAILGMAKNNDDSILNALVDSGIVSSEAFSICFREEYKNNGGLLTVGGSIRGVLEDGLEPMVYAEMQQSPDGLFKVWVDDMYLQEGGGGEETELNSIKIIMDEELFNHGGGVTLNSGVTETNLPQYIEQAFKDAWKEVTGSTYSDSPVELSEHQLRSLPTIQFNLQVANLPVATEELLAEQDVILSYPESALVAMPSTHYMMVQEDGTYKPQIHFTADNVNIASVLGSNFMTGYEILFDIENTRIGFAQSECDPIPLTQDRPLAPDKSYLQKGEYCTSMTCRRSLTLFGIFLAFLLALISWTCDSESKDSSFVVEITRRKRRASYRRSREARDLGSERGQQQSEAVLT